MQKQIAKSFCNVVLKKTHLRLSFCFSAVDTYFTCANNDLTPFQQIPTPIHSMMNADRRSTTIVPVCPIRLTTDSS